MLRNWIAGSSCSSADAAGEAPTWSPACTISVWLSMPACALRRYDAMTAALPTGRLPTNLPAESWPWKSLKPSSLTLRLPPWQSDPSATGVCTQARSALHESVVHGLRSSQPPGQTGVVQTTVRDPVSGQPAAASPSETVSVRVAGPAAAQVKVGLCAVALSSVPLDAGQAYDSAAGAASASWACAVSDSDAPTNTSPGLAPSATID